MYTKIQNRRQIPKLEGACVTTLELLSLERRAQDGRSSHRRVDRFQEGVVFVDVAGVSGPDASVWVTVEIGPDAQRWADLCRHPPLTAKGFYAIPVENFGAYLRLSYRIRGSVRFGAEFQGKQFAYAGEAGNGGTVRGLSAGGGPGHPDHVGPGDRD